MSNWLAGAVSRAGTVSDWLSPKRQQSLALLQAAQWPTRKTEAWKYTSLRALENTECEHAANQPVRDVETISGLHSIDLVFVDGVLQTDLSAENFPAGLSITSLASANSSTQDWALKAFSSIKPARHLFGLVNDVLATTGLIIDVAAAAVIEQPIRIVNRFSAGQEAHTRVLCRLGTGSQATVIEQHCGSENSVNTGFAEFDLAEQAQLQHYRLALQTGEAVALGGSHFKLAGRAQLNSTLVGFGSSLSRLDIDVTHAGEQAVAKLNAIYLVDGAELFDLHSTIEHVGAAGTTEENVRGIVADKARAVFNGRIHIHRDAQKTQAQLNNRNLLMSAEAEIYTKPELEIYADDVRCAHGATVAAIDKTALYYLQSRGVSKRQAQVMLSFGFINELVDQMPNQLLAEWLRPQLRQRFAAMDVK
jgi:Fe-S cluster assembly protein SufD